MIIFYGFLMILAILGMTIFSANILMCILVILAAAGGILCQFLLDGKWKKLSGLLIVIGLLLCLWTGRGGSVSVAVDYQAEVEDAMELMDDGDLDEAKVQLEKLDENFGPSDASRYAWAYLNLYLNDYATARSYMAQIEENKTEAWYLRMEEIYVREGTEEAQTALMELYLQAAEALPENAHMQLMAGVVKIDLQDSAGAIYYLTRAYQLDMEEPLSAYYLGTLYYEKGNFEDASLYFGEALLRGADMETASYIKWYVLQMEGAEE